MPEQVTLHHKDGSKAKMDSVDARRALQEHPEEWSTSPFAKDKPTNNTPPAPPITNDGLKVGHIPSEVPALEPKVYTAKHRGGGSYSIVDADGNEVMEKLSKDDAEAFNGMTAEEKAAYVQADSANS